MLFWQYQAVSQLWRRRSAATAHSALPVCEWPALDKPWSTARSDAVSAVCSRRGGACTGLVLLLSGLGTWLVGVAVLLVSGSFSIVVDNSAQSWATVRVACPGNILDHYKLKCSLCSVNWLWWSMHWVLRPGWTGGGLWWLWYQGISQLWRRRLATPLPRALPVCEWPALHCKVKSSLCSVQQAWWSLHWVLQPGWAVVCRGCGCAECQSFQDVEAPLGNHSAQSPASV